MLSDMIRKSFLSFFEQRGHTVVASSPIIPAGDTTLLFTNAGMNQFKGVFLGKEERSYSRATSCQKCLRVSGKHNDLESVGMTNRHHTFFEMLGNFSFGDYFKIGAIEYAWEYVTQVLNIPIERLWATVYKDDTEAEEIWIDRIEIDKNRIWHGGEKDNYWAMGDIGPCGPCSEIHYDWGEKFSCKEGCPSPKDCERFASSTCPRFIELWNLVFMQYNRDENGNLQPLPKPSVDTGAGLERIAAVMQGVYFNYDTDLFKPIMTDAAKLLGGDYSNDSHKSPLRVIADHMRALTFGIADGVTLSNEGRGYVLRRILRRALRHGRQTFKYPQPFLHKLIPSVIKSMEKAYPELHEKEEYINVVILQEEENFSTTLDRGLIIFEELVNHIRSRKETVVSGKDIFELYSTYGFPADMTVIMANEAGLSADVKSFDSEMESHREKSRDKSKFAVTAEAAGVTVETPFYGYDKLSAETFVFEADEEKIILEETPFYAESGGQTADMGQISNQNFEFLVTSVKKSGSTILHFGEYSRGETPQKGDSVTAKVNTEARAATARNHTATHLLHAALKEVVGKHASQSGSYVGPDRLRFDFTHYQALTEEQIRKVEEIVNKKIVENLPVSIQEKTFQEAKEEGAIAIFEEKYGDNVRVVTVEKFSKELCGGTHVSRTGNIGFFKIVSESSIQAGVRRIEALTGLASFWYVNRLHKNLAAISNTLQVADDEKTMMKRIQDLLEKEKEFNKLKEIKQTEQAKSKIDELIEKIEKDAKEKEGLRTLVYPVEDINIARGAWDKIKTKLEQTALLFEISKENSAQLAVAFSKDLTAKGFNAGTLSKELGTVIGGSGGGRADLGQAGGSKPSEFPNAREKFMQYCSEQAK
ncbi:MAG: alanine--tRNA ligase [Planctomycetota bacterium]